MSNKSLLSLLLVAIVLLALLTSCCKHELKDATCTEPQVCTKCGITHGKALGHNYADEKIQKEATCTENGVKETICTVCGDKKTTEIPAGHKWEFVGTERAATCSAEGQEKYQCSVCGETKFESLAKLKHQYKDGYCINCFTEDPKGVKFNPSADEKEQITKVKTIGDREVRKEDDFYYLLFSFSDSNFNTVVAPCVLDVRIVNDNDETVYRAKRIVDVSDYGKWSNAYREWILASPKIVRSDIKEGSSSSGTLYFTVTLIDTYFKEHSLRIYSLPVHSFGEWKIKKAATCVEDGVKEKVCSSCGQIVTETIPATGKHTYRVEKTLNSSCVAVGSIEKKCTFCGKILIEKKPLAAHSYLTEVLIAATCGEDGILKSTCSSCGKVVENKIPATGKHTYQEVILAEATCGSDGVLRTICSSCGKVIDEEVTSATGKHVYRKGTVAIEPTCLTEGLMEYACTVCGFVGRTEILKKLEHSFVNDKCTYCGTLRIGSKGPAGGYIFYDCDLDNEDGNPDGLISSECGWRFLEAAPKDIGTAVFGFYRNSANGDNLCVNGYKYYYEENCTRKEIGYGKSNTEMLVDAMGNSAYTYYSGSETTGRYAAKMCADYILGRYDDWFLPSEGELKLMYKNLKKEGLGNFQWSGYWSSSESSGDYAWKQYFYNGDQNVNYRSSNFYVRPIRAFL